VSYTPKYQDLLTRAKGKPLDFSMAEVWQALFDAEAFIHNTRHEPESLPYIGVELTDEQIKDLDLKPGPIQVVYPLDEEWNAALEAAAGEATCADPNDGRDHAECPFCSIATDIRKLKRSRATSPQHREENK